MFHGALFACPDPSLCSLSHVPQRSPHFLQDFPKNRASSAGFRAHAPVYAGQTPGWARPTSGPRISGGDGFRTVNFARNEMIFFSGCVLQGETFSMSLGRTHTGKFSSHPVPQRITFGSSVFQQCNPSPLGPLFPSGNSRIIAKPLSNDKPSSFQAASAGNRFPGSWAGYCPVCHHGGGVSHARIKPR